MADGDVRPSNCCLPLNSLSPRKQYMDQNVFQFLEVERVDPQKRSLRTRITTFREIYRLFTDNQMRLQANRCLGCGNPYCEWRCPVHNHIPDWLKLAGEGRIFEAAERCHLTNSLPEVCGRVCPQDRLCEGACTLHDEYGAVTIGSVEKYLVDTAFSLGWRPDLSRVMYSGKRAAVIGAGPAGLGCADILVRNGVRPTVFDRYPEIGGLLTFGIPEFKLEKDVMVRRRQVFTDMGIEFMLGREIGTDIAFTDLLAAYDAVFVATGSYRPISGGLANEEASGVYRALDYLVGTVCHERGFAWPGAEYVSLRGRQVLVLGGGDTAMDCLRTAIRQGADRVRCAYRRNEQNMPGSVREVANARDEGVEFLWNLQPCAMIVDGAGRVTGVEVVRTEMGPPDERGRRRPLAQEGTEHILEADAVILAFGFTPEPTPWLEAAGVSFDRRGRIVVGGGARLPYQSGVDKIFAGGDAVRGSDLVVTAIAEGRQAAEAMLAYLEA